MCKEINLETLTNSHKEKNSSFNQHNESISCFSVDRLVLTNFRNFERLGIRVGSLPIILTGPNGSGKTNILEALSLLVPGRGFRKAKLASISRIDGGGSWAVSADIIKPGGKITIGTGFSLSHKNGKRDNRVIQIDGKIKKNQNSLKDLINVIWLTPQMDGLFNGAPSGRRSFFDRLVSSWDPFHQTRINLYRSKMKERLILLARLSGEDTHWLTVIENVLTEQAIAIAAARMDYLSRIAPIASKNFETFPGAQLDLIGDLEARLQDHPAIQVEDWFREKLKKSRSLDIAAGRTSTGPHLSDLQVYHKPKKQLAEFCSTGEQKALLISIILANAQLAHVFSGVLPLLLLDEITAHLDEGRRGALFRSITDFGVQAWVTGTDENLFSSFSENAQRLKLENGKINFMDKIN